MKTSLTVLVALAGLLAFAGPALSHCEIPCGIYGDAMRIHMMKEDMTTVDKSMKMIRTLGAEEQSDWNQLVRRVKNKEEHAGKIQHVVTQYWMTQRVKVPKDGEATPKETYEKQLTLLHKLLVTAMKMKQTTDQAHVDAARKLVDEFAATYFSPEDLKHLKDHK